MPTRKKRIKIPESQLGDARDWLLRRVATGVNHNPYANERQIKSLTHSELEDYLSDERHLSKEERALLSKALYAARRRKMENSRTTRPPILLTTMKEIRSRMEEEDVESLDDFLLSLLERT